MKRQARLVAPTTTSEKAGKTTTRTKKGKGEQTGGSRAPRKTRAPSTPVKPKANESEAMNDPNATDNVVPADMGSKKKAQKATP